MEKEYKILKLNEKEYILLKELLAEKIISLKINNTGKALTDKELLERQIELNKYKSLLSIMSYLER